MKQANRGISIIICCYNSARRLPETLRHIARQEVLPHIPWEVVVVDNASRDNTAGVATSVWNALGSSTPFRVVAQPLAGLSNAREKGIETAQYEYLLFCDDDNWLDKDYVQIAFRKMEDNPKIGVLGGLGKAAPEVADPPRWFLSLTPFYAVGPQSSRSGSLEPGGAVFGAGSVYRKEALGYLKAKGFASLLNGREGDKLSSGEDYELCYALTLAGYEIWYEESLRFSHFIPKERITWKYLVKNFEGIAEAYPILMAYKLTIATRFHNRKPMKNSWYWLILMRIQFFAIDIKDSLALAVTHTTKEAWLKLYFSLKSTHCMYVCKRRYEESMNRIENSGWVRKHPG